MGDTSDAPDRVRAFVDESYGRVVAAVALATGDASTAEDGVQDALVKVLHGGHNPDNLAAWVTVVATNEVRQAHRRRGVETRVLHGSKERVHDSTEGVATATDVHSAVSDLPERQREIVLLHYYLDVSVADTASAMDISEGTVKTQLHRARAKLAVTLALGEEQSP